MSTFLDVNQVADELQRYIIGTTIIYPKDGDENKLKDYCMAQFLSTLSDSMRFLKAEPAGDMLGIEPYVTIMPADKTREMINLLRRMKHKRHQLTDELPTGRLMIPTGELYETPRG